MKVGTDGILIGAWTEFESPKSILDIGTGSGLIAMMMCQRFPGAMVTAVELDADSATQARQNFEASPWPERLQVVEGDVRETQHSAKFDLIVTNPPYFHHSFRSEDPGRQMARHTDSLSHAELAATVSRLLSDDGQFGVVLPAESRTNFMLLCSAEGLHCSRICDVYPTPTSPVKRVLMQFGRHDETKARSESLVIELQRHDYSSEFKQLIKAFYLKY